MDGRALESQEKTFGGDPKCDDRFPQVYAYVETYQIVHLTRVQLVVCQLYLSKSVF